MNNYVKLIDYFVHDMLDYTVLQTDSDNFIHEVTSFDLSECINQIYEILEDKIKMKEIKVKISLSGFNSRSTNVQTDKKRLQQVLLNLISNSIKYTDRNGCLQVHA